MSSRNSFETIVASVEPARSRGDQGFSLLRFLSGLLRARPGAAERRRLQQELAALREEMFHIRAELALLRSRYAHGRRESFSVTELLRLGNRREVEAVIRAHTQSLVLADGTLLCRVLARHKLLVDGADAGIGPHLLLDGFWEYWVTEFVARNLGRGETAFDVGAGYGYYSLLFADLVGPEGRVRAFEPNPRAHALLARSLMLNGMSQASAHAVAVCARGGGTVRLQVPPSTPQSAHILPRDAPEPDSAAGGLRVYAVPTVALDDFAEERVDLVKIDAPGAEGEIWRGMQGLITRQQPRLRILFDFDARRVPQAARLLEQFARHFPLRLVEGDGRARPCTAEEVLGRDAAAMLYLSQVEPR
ncbi:MAG: FkbM family methyltransferase [Acetobacteraceae bacterium]|nr:FkbM family methyltransferase [Acetobacteraceae bacterium]